MLRAVALAYRRAHRAGTREHDCYEAALAEYLRIDPAAPADHLEASQQVGLMIAVAINATPAWFWSGPDA